MKILVVSNGYPPRGRFGTEFYARALVHGLRSRGHSVEVLHPVRDSQAPRYSLETVEEEGVPVHLLHNSGDTGAGFEASYRDREVERVFGDLLRAGKFDLVHCVYLLWGLSIGLPATARSLGVPLVLTATDHSLVCHRGQMFDYSLQHCGGPRDAATCAKCIRTPAPYDLAPLPLALKSWAVSALSLLGGLGKVVTRRDVEAREIAVREALGQACHVIAPTAPIGAALLKRGLDANKLSELVYSFDEGPYAAVRSIAPPTSVRIGFLGQLAPHKGLATLIDAARVLARERGPDSFELVLHGAPSEGRHREFARRVLSQVEPARVTRGAPFGPDQAPEILAGFSALAVPSLWDENAPLAVLQSRAAGVPILGSAVAGIRAVVEDPQHGRLIEPGDVSAWARAMGEVVDGKVPRLQSPGLPLSLAAHLDTLEAIYGSQRASQEER